MELKTPPGKNSFSIWSFPVSRKPLFWWIIAGSIFLLLAIPVEVHLKSISIIRLLILLFIAKEIWSLFQPTGNKIMVTFFLHIVQILLLFSPIIIFFSNISLTSASHFFFISLLFLLILIVSARVILSHGGHGLIKESKSILFFTAYCMVIAGIFLRTFSDYFSSYVPVYKTTSIILFLACTIWLLEILHSIIYIRAENK
jgi:hypothetical protein